MGKGEICLAHKVCTDCPIRSDCTIRQIFYSEAEYAEFKEETTAMSLRSAALMGIPPFFAKLGTYESMQMMDNRRKQELALHPTYSPK